MAPRWTGVLARPEIWSIALSVGLVLGAARCGPAGGPSMGPAEPQQPGVTAAPGEAVDTPGIALDADHTLGPPVVVGNLAVFPVYARRMEDLGEFLPLDAALEKGLAVVREVGAGNDGPQQPIPQQAQPQMLYDDNWAPLDDGNGNSNGNGNARAQRANHGDGAQVNTLVIANKGDVAILVLAGTVVKGGKQDRQIGQDFIIGKRQTVPVDAFCVEHGRWTAVRDGVATGGSFKTLKTLAAGDVRAARPDERTQGQVWSKVGQINRDNGKETASDTLTASLEDTGAAAERGRVGATVQAFLARVPMAERTVGLAYAVGGEVLGARWFIHHKLFAQYAETLVNTAVGESFNARAVSRTKGLPDAPGACALELVATFVNAPSHGRHEKRATSGDNVNAYEFSADVYAAEAQVKSASPAAAPKAVTKDFLKKR